MMMRLLLHHKEYHVKHESQKAILVRFCTYTDDYKYIRCSRDLWIPKSQIQRWKRKWIDGVEPVLILELPEWLVEEKGLQQYYYSDVQVFIAKVEKHFKRKKVSSFIVPTVDASQDTMDEINRINEENYMEVEINVDYLEKTRKG